MSRKEGAEEMPSVLGTNKTSGLGNSPVSLLVRTRPPKKDRKVYGRYLQLLIELE